MNIDETPDVIWDDWIAIYIYNQLKNKKINYEYQKIINRKKLTFLEKIKEKLMFLDNETELAAIIFDLLEDGKINYEYNLLTRKDKLKQLNK